MTLSFCLSVLSVPLLVCCQPPGFEYSKYIRFPPLNVLKFAVFLQNDHDNCSGTIIHERWVLTAAHCVYHDGDFVGHKGVKVVAGITNTDYNSMAFRVQEAFSEHIIVHSGFKHDVLSKYDIAVIKLNKALNFSNAIDKAEIGQDPWPQEENGTRTCYSWGFGNIAAGQDTNTKLKLWKTTATHGDHACPCVNKFQQKRLVCGEEAVGINLCRGDLGSSLVCYKGEDPLQYLWDGEVFWGEKKEEASARLSVYGVAHMTLDKYKCKIARLPKASCLRIPTFSTYMFLCRLLPFMVYHSVPGVPGVHRCRAPAVATTPVPLVLAAFILTLLSKSN